MGWEAWDQSIQSAADFADSLSAAAAESLSAVASCRLAGPENQLAEEEYIEMQILLAETLIAREGGCLTFAVEVAGY